MMSGDEFYDEDVTSGIDRFMFTTVEEREHSSRPKQIAEAVERIRAHHDRTLGHSPTNRVGYCAEPDGVSATYCETGILLAAVR